MNSRLNTAEREFIYWTIGLMISRHAETLKEKLKGSGTVSVSSLFLEINGI
jgi:hypothetical protein